MNHVDPNPQPCGDIPAQTIQRSLRPGAYLRDLFGWQLCLTAIIWSWGCAAPGGQETAMEEAAAKGSPLIGESAPDFTLMNQSDKKVSLSQFRGQWVVLYFYPADDTPGCTCQATEFTQLLSQFHNLNATVIGISPDTTLRHREFRQKYSIKITLLNDADHRVAETYGAWTQMGWKDKRIGRMIRSTVLIDPDGQIAYHWPEVIPQGHADRVRRKLMQIKDQRRQGTAQAPRP